MSNQSTSQNYFNLHTTGIGYLSDIREFLPKKGDPILSCRVSALVGPSDKPEYRFFDMNVVGEEAKRLIERCRDAVAAKKKVLISFVMADLWYDIFTYSTDSQYHKKGDTGVALKGRLIRINMIKVDGEVKYPQPEAKVAQSANGENQ